MSNQAMVTNKNGYELDFNQAVDYMDDDIREELHSKLSPCSEQEFFTAYENSHVEKLGEEWFLSSSSPSW